MKIKDILLIILSVCIFTVPSFAEVTVTSVIGQAKYKTGNQWTPLAPGIKLTEGGKVSTGVNSSVVLNINGNPITIKQMSMIKIEENSLSDTESNTKIALKRGGLSARISKLKTLKTNFKISSPVATSSVRGTWEDFSYGPGMGATVQVLEGVVFAENNLGSGNQLSGNLEFKQDNNNSVPEDPNSGRKEDSRGGLVNNLTPEEQNFMQNNTSDNIVATPEPLPTNEVTQIITNGGGVAKVNITPVFP